MNYRARRFRKVNRSFKFSLLLIIIVVVFNFALLSGGGGEDLGMLVFNTPSESSLARNGSADWKISNASGFMLNEGYPRPRIFTPNGDGKNEEVTFEYENINESSIVCWIYDIKGAVIKQLDIVETGENKFTWDGKDENKEVAASGIYIYQIEVEGQTINGTIVLAK